MEHGWTRFLELLPPWLREAVDRHPGAETQLRQLRLRVKQPPAGDFPGGCRVMAARSVTGEDLECVLGRASGYGAYSCIGLNQGYISAPGGHRVGVCGTAVVKDGAVTGMREVTSVCIRVARDYPGCAAKVMPGLWGSALLLGVPGSGKTTLLRDVCRQLAKTAAVAVADERGELFPEGMDRLGVDVLTGCDKARGVDMLLRTMSPQVIAVDEITRAEDCRRLLEAAGCGVRLLATAHGRDRLDLRRRPVYRELLEAGIFDRLVLVNGPGKYETEGFIQ